MSEEQFAASLNSPTSAGLQEAGMAPRADLREAMAAVLAEISATPLQDQGPASVARGSDRGPLSDNEPEWDLASSSAQPHGAVMNEPQWKQEVASRLENYRSRRGSRRPRYEGTLSLDFDRAANRMLVEDPGPPAPTPVDSAGYVQNAALAADSFAGDVPPMSVPALERQAMEFSSAEPQPEPAASNLIEFPRSPTLFEPMVPSDNDLAEPMIDRPRILEVPEEVHCAQAPLAGIELEPEEEPEAIAGVELPLRVAPMGRRLFAGLLDAVIVAIATVLFIAVIVYMDVPPPPHGKAALALLAALPAALWAMYEYLFLVHAGRTPGMQMARVTITEFDGARPNRRTRRVRAIGTVLSLLSLGLGVFWALLDEDTLCWHDRMSRTYIAQSSTQELTAPV